MTKTRSEDGSMVPKSMQLWSAWCPYVLTFGLLVLFIVALGIHSYARELPGLELVLFSLATLHAWFFYRGEFAGPHSISQPILLTFICIAMCFGDMVRGELLGCVGFGILSVIWSAITWRRGIGRAAMKRERRAKLERVVESVTRAVKATNETKRRTRLHLVAFGVVCHEQVYRQESLCLSLRDLIFLVSFAEMDAAEELF
ncbi:MAG: hypothetical protein VX668_01010 [Planctomycetota bacterium]|nr:hypothetical protein [Planctomycetota bacterium]